MDEHNPLPTTTMQAAFTPTDVFRQMADRFPYPIQVFTADGLSVYLNRAALREIGIQSVEAHVGRYNVFADPFVLGQGVADQIRQVLNGKTVHLPGFSASYQEMMMYYRTEDRDVQTIRSDITCFPLPDADGTVHYFASVFLMLRLYRNRAEIQRGREYIDAHWQEPFDAEAVADAANLSLHYFSRLFRKHMALTPHEYYINLKIRHIQERLLDESLNVAEAFAACGVDYHGHFARVFREKTGLSPSRYRAAARR